MTAKGKPGTRQERVAIEETLCHNVLSVDVYQKKPYTMALVLCSHDDIQYTELGFTKVCWPDKWDEKRGVDLAEHKAICAIAKRIQECQAQQTERTD